MRISDTTRRERAGFLARSVFGSANPSAPRTWKRYSYVDGDPTNENDPDGLCGLFVAGITENADTSKVQGYASEAIAVYPYSNQSNNSSAFSKLSNVLYGVAQVALQAFGATSSTYAVVVGLELASMSGNGINVVTFSGGAAAFTAAVTFLNGQGAAGQGIVSMIDSIVYVAPGAIGPLYGGTQDTPVAVVTGGAVNTLVGLGASPPASAIKLTDTKHCGHDFQCLTDEFGDFFMQGENCDSPAVVNQGGRLPPAYPGNMYWYMMYYLMVQGLTAPKPPNTTIGIPP